VSLPWDTVVIETSRPEPFAVVVREAPGNVRVVRYAWTGAEALRYARAVGGEMYPVIDGKVEVIR
jgi:hypothetical protein